jgi:hypothetical protein
MFTVYASESRTVTLEQGSLVMCSKEIGALGRVLWCPQEFNISLYVSFNDLFSDAFCNWSYTASNGWMMDECWIRQDLKGSGHGPFQGVAWLLCDGTNLCEGGEVKGKQDGGVSEPVSSHSNTRNRLPEANWTVCLSYLLMRPIHGQSCCATRNVAQHDWSCMGPLREHGLVRSAHTLTLSSAHVPSHCNRTVLSRDSSRELREIPKWHCQDSRCPGRDSNRAPSEYKSQVLLLELPSSMICQVFKSSLIIKMHIFSLFFSRICAQCRRIVNVTLCSSVTLIAGFGCK